MKIEPTYCTVGELLQYRPMFFVPKYQRSYAWDKDELEDFMNDLKTCFLKKKDGESPNHFFGGIVTVKYSVVGAVNQHKYEIIDGQQRIATFVILMASIAKIYSELQKEANAAGDNDNEGILAERIKLLRERCIEFSQEIQREKTIVEVLELSKADKQFFKDLIRGNEVCSGRASHDRLKYAFDAIIKLLRDLIISPTLITKIDSLGLIENILAQDLTIIHMVTQKKKDAFRLFQVINDRGISLTEGDLLRARTMEMLEDYNYQQASAAEAWDEILRDLPNKTNDYLRWIYSSFTAKRAGKATLFDDMLYHFYPMHTKSRFTSEDAEAILTSTNNIMNAVLICRKLKTGEWPFKHGQPITGWDRNRLDLLIKELGLTICIPILLAAADTLDPRKFFEIIQLLEKFMVRYKIMCLQHEGPVKKILNEEAKRIRTNFESYELSTLKLKLTSLQDSKTNDTLVSSFIDNLQYATGRSNKPLKFLLINFEYFLSWYNSGATGVPLCVDKNRTFEFTDTTIEHIYPRNAQGSVIDNSLEEYKNAIGNLTILDPIQNVTGENDNFNTKKKIYRDSSVHMNQEIAENEVWNIEIINERALKLKEIACKVFKI